MAWGARNLISTQVPWFAVDRDDCAFEQCDVYNVDGVAYESILVHGRALLHGPAVGGEPTRPTWAFRATGFTSLGRTIDGRFDARLVERPRARPSSPASGRAKKGSGRSGRAVYKDYEERTALATLRRDGFARLQATNGTATTRPLAFSFVSGPRYLWVNACVKNQPVS